jgi:tellurite methyltransferase
MATDIYLSHPQPYVRDVLRWCNKGTLLDVGAGWGRNTRYFADRGFAVTAVDTTPDAIARLRAYSAESGHAIKVIQQDLRDLTLTTRYDVVLCTMMLHFLSTEAEVAEAISKLQEATSADGINVVSLYTSHNPPGLKPYLAAPGALVAAYRRWLQLDYYEGPGRWHVPSGGGPRRRNYLERLTARKPARGGERLRGHRKAAPPARRCRPSCVETVDRTLSSQRRRPRE